MIGTREIIALVVVALVAVAISLAGQHYLDLREAAAQNAISTGKLHAASEGIEQGTQIDRAQASTTTGIAQGREGFAITIDEAKRHEPETASRADRVVPDSVRAAYRARRVARERLGCVGRECEEGR